MGDFQIRDSRMPEGRPLTPEEAGAIAQEDAARATQLEKDTKEWASHEAKQRQND